MNSDSYPTSADYFYRAQLDHIAAMGGEIPAPPTPEPVAVGSYATAVALQERNSVLAGNPIIAVTETLPEEPIYDEPAEIVDAEVVPEELRTFDPSTTFYINKLVKRHPDVSEADIRDFFGYAIDKRNNKDDKRSQFAKDIETAIEKKAEVEQRPKHQQGMLAVINTVADPRKGLTLFYDHTRDL